VREIMAELGVKNFNDLIGRSDLLDMQTGIDHWKIHGLDFTKIFYRPELSDEVGTYHQETQDHGLDKALDHELIKQAKDAIDNKGSCVIDTPITNINRTAGTLLSHEIAKRYGNDGLPEDSIQVNLSGTAGQSFGAFLAKGITFNLEGEGNDYVGKGLCGGKIIIKPPKTFNAKASENIIVGNTVMYGATSGKTFFSGIAGERFCVRNSGASAVVEGVGNHGCEYMTGGTVAVLGPTGQNFAAGMSGGVAYIFDVNKTFEANCNKSMVTLEKVLPANSQPSEAQHLNQPDELILKSLVSDHLKYTNSEVAKHILDNWDDMLNHFVKVMPNEYRRALNELQEKTNKETV